MRTYHPKVARRDPLMRFLCLGAGVQSTTVFLLALDGQIEPFDGAIFADTQWEPQEVYDHLDKLAAMADEAGLPLHVVTAGDIRSDALNPDHRFASMPLYVRRPDEIIERHQADCASWTPDEFYEAHDDMYWEDIKDRWVQEHPCDCEPETIRVPPKREGQGRRQCTNEYKIQPIRDCIRELVAERLGIEAPTWRQVPKDVRVEEAFGISTDEIRRARTPRDRWAINYYPLLERRWSRADCYAYLEGRGIDTPRSACIGCPYRSDGEWRHLRDNAPAAWKDAVEFDAAIRDVTKRRTGGRYQGDEYLHRSLKPLPLVDLKTPDDHGQTSLWDAECEGMCGL